MTDIVLKYEVTNEKFLWDSHSYTKQKVNGRAQQQSNVSAQWTIAEHNG